MVETTTLADDDLLSGSEQIAEFVHLSHRHVQALLRSGALPDFRHGKRAARGACENRSIWRASPSKKTAGARHERLPRA